MQELQDAHRDVGRGQARDENSEPTNRMSPNAWHDGERKKPGGEGRANF
jgi:hypothetical protein